ncbi:MAG: dienelactone hydrolase family protein, partial [Acidimicrobiia bacterium]
RTAFGAVLDRRALADLEEAYDFAARPGTEWAGADSVGLLGLGAGGRIALLAAARRPEVAAVAVAYAPLDEGNDEEHMSVLEAVSQIEVPILGLYCHDDGVVPVERVHQARGRAKGGEWIIYHDTGHDFMDEGRAEYNAPSAADALSRIVGFLSEHLPAPVGVT